MGILSFFKAKDTKVSSKKLRDLTHNQLQNLVRHEFLRNKIEYPKSEFFPIFLGSGLHNSLQFKYYPEVVRFRFSIQEPLHPDTTVIQFFSKFADIVKSLTLEQKRFLGEFGFLPRNTNGELFGDQELENYKAQKDDEIHQKKTLSYVMESRLNKAMRQTHKNTLVYGNF